MIPDTLFFFKYTFVYLFLAMLGFHGCEGLFFSLVAVQGLLTAVVSLVAERGSRACGF